MTSHCLYCFFKCLGSRHIHKEIKLQDGKKGIKYILCKTDLDLIRWLAYKCNTLNDAHFEARCKSTFVLFTISIKACFETGVFSFYEVTSIYTDSCLNSIHHISYRCSFEQVFFVKTTSNLNYVFFPVIKSYWHFIFMKIIESMWLKIIWKNSHNVIWFCFAVFITFVKREYIFIK